MHEVCASVVALFHCWALLETSIHWALLLHVQTIMLQVSKSQCISGGVEVYSQVEPLSATPGWDMPCTLHPPDVHMKGSGVLVTGKVTQQQLLDMEQEWTPPEFCSPRQHPTPLPSGMRLEAVHSFRTILFIPPAIDVS